MNGRKARTRLLRSVAKPAYAWGACGAVCALIVGAFFAGAAIAKPGENTQETAEPRPVTAQVERRVVQPGVQLAGKKVEAAALDLKLSNDTVLGAALVGGDAAANTEKAPPVDAAEKAAPAPGSHPDRNIVTRTVAAAGNVLAPGDLLAEVSGVPVIAAPTNTPLYRDFAVGISGEDVRALQRMIADLGYPVDVDGICDADTMNAVAYWYAQFGYTLPGGEGSATLPWRQLLPLPSGVLTVVRPSAVGTVLAAEVGLAKVRRGSAVVEATVDAVQAEKFQPASDVYVRTAGKSIKSRVVSLGPLETNEDSGASGHKLTVALPDELVSASTPLVIATEPAGDLALALPLIAIDEDDRGHFVTLADANGEAPQKAQRSEKGQKHQKETVVRVDIEVLAVSGGWAALSETPQLVEGTAVRVR